MSSDDPWRDTRKRLDDLAEKGCMLPGCEHKDHDPNTLFFQQICHDVPRLFDRFGGSSGFGGVLTFRCALCMKPIMSFKPKTESIIGHWEPVADAQTVLAGASDVGEVHVLHSGCCDVPECGGFYTMGSGKIMTRCNRCGKKTGEFTI